MNSMWKRSFALLLSLVMVFGMVPVNAFAEDSGAVACDATAECQAVADHAEGCLKAIAEAEAAKAAEEAAKAAAEAAKAAEEAAAKAAEEAAKAAEEAAAKAAEEAAAKAAEEAAKAAEEAANQPSVCNKQEDCPAAENHAEDCLKAIADAEAAKAAEEAAKAAEEAAASAKKVADVQAMIDALPNEVKRTELAAYEAAVNEITAIMVTMTEEETGKLTGLEKLYPTEIIEDGVAVIGNQYFATLRAAIDAVVDGQTITVLSGTIEEGSLKLPASLSNVTIQGQEGTVLKNTTIQSADGSSVSYVGLTFTGITFDNSGIVMTGWRTNVVYKDLTITNCVFRNLDNASNTAPVHLNLAEAEAVNGFVFTNNTIDGATGGQKSGIYAQVTGNTVISGNTINNVSFRPYVVQISNNDGVSDTFVVKNNTFSGSAVGRAQGLGSNAAGMDSVTLTVSGNIFKGITGSQQICYWNFNAAKTTADLSKNYYDVDIAKNPGKIYYNSEAASTGDLKTMGVFPYYTGLDESGAIDPKTLTFPTYGSVTYGYTSANSIWGECSGNAKESLVIKFYSGETFMGSTTLNNIDGIIDGDVFVTWNMLLDAQSNQDAYWTMAWEKEKAPSLELQPDRLELWIDGAKVDENVIKLNGPDNRDPLVAAVADGDGTIVGYTTSAAEALTLAKNAALTKVTIVLLGENTKDTADKFNLYTEKVFDSVTFKQKDPSKVYYLSNLKTGSRTNDGKFVFDGVNLHVTGQYIFEGNVELTNNSVITSSTEHNCFFYNNTTTIEPGSRLQGVIEEFRGGTVIVDGGKTDGTYSETPGLKDSIMTVSWNGDKLILKNGAYVNLNAANEVGRLTISAGTAVEVDASKLDSFQYIDLAANGTLQVDTESQVKTPKITGIGKIVIDAKDYTPGKAVPIDADVSAFNGTVETINSKLVKAAIVDGRIVFTDAVAKIGEEGYYSLADALAAAKDGETVELIWAEGDDAISMKGEVTGNKTVTITGKALVNWHAGWLFVGRSHGTATGDGKLIFKDAELWTKDSSGDKAIHVSGKENGAANKNNGTLELINSKIELDYLINKGNVIVNGGELKVKYGFDVAGRPANETVDGEDATATFTVTNGAAVTILNEQNMGFGREGKGILNINGGSFTVQNDMHIRAKGTVNVEGGSLTVTGTMYNNGAVNVYDESTLNIKTNSGEDIILCEGAIIKDSSVGGDAYVTGKVIFRGDNTFNNLYDFGTYYTPETPHEWTVEAGASVTLTHKDGTAYGLGYGDNVTINGSLQNALTARGGSLPEKSFFSEKGVRLSTSAGNDSANGSFFTVNNAYAVIGNNGTFSNASGDTGKYTIALNNSVIDTAQMYFDNRGSVIDLSITGSDVLTNIFMTADTDSVYKVTDSKVVTTGSGNDRYNGNAGNLTITNSTVEIRVGNYTNKGNITMCEGSKLTAPALVNTGKIIIDASGYQTGDVVIELTNATPSKEMVTVTGAEGASVEVVENELVIAVPVAKVGDDYYTTLKDALDNAAPGATVTLMKDITVSENWDCRYTGTKLTKAITIDGAGHTMTFTGMVIDNNHFSVFRFEAPATVKNLNIDMSQCTNTGNMRAISTKADLVVENCDFTGNTTSNSRAIIFGEGSGAAIGEVDVKITGSTFTNWKRGLTDNENGQDVESVEVTGNTFTNAAVYISAKKDLTFTGNTVSGAKVSITTYSKPAELSATATGNTLDAAQTNTIKAAVINAQPEFAAAVVAKIGSKTYGTLQAAVNAVQNGETIVVQTDITGAENVVVPNGVTFTLNLNDKTFNGTIKVPNADLTVKNGKIVNTNSSVNAVESTGTLTVTNVDITSARAAVRVEGGKATLTGGTYRTNNAGGMTVNTINVSGNSKVTVENVTVYGPKGTGADAGAAVASRDTAAVTIKSGNFSGGVLNTLSGASKNNIVVTGGTYDQNPGEFCEDRYAPAYDSAKGTWTVVEAAAYVTGADNVPAYYPTVADAVKATDNGETLTIIADRKDPTKDTSVTKTAAMNIAANAQGGVTVTANVPANSKYVQIPVKGVTYRVGAYGDLTISKNGVVGGDNVPIKDGKPDYTLKPLNSEASYLSGSNATLTFESNMIFATFTKAYIDGTEITVNKDYVATPGSTIIELANARLRTLTAGKHILMIRDDSDNTVSCEFHVTVNANADKTNPKTGDEIFVPMFVMFSTAAALAVLVMGKKKYF